MFRSGDGAVLPENIWWDARTDEVVWVDIRRGTLHRGRLDGAVDGSNDRVVEIEAPLSAVQPAVDGFVATLRDRVVLLDSEGKVLRTVAETPHAHEGLRLNDARVDPFGRLIVGAIDETTDAADARVFSIDADGGVRVIAGGFRNANGLDWTDAGDTWYIADTTDTSVYRVPYGSHGPVGVLEPLLDGQATDGLVLDADGCLWGAVFGEGVVRRWTSDADEVDSVSVPAPTVTSVGFGGPDLGTLLVATSRDGLSDDELSAHPQSGSIFRVDGRATGRPVHVFGAR